MPQHVRKATSLEHLPQLGLHPASPAGGFQVLKAPRSQPLSEVLGDTPALLLAIHWLPENPSTVSPTSAHLPPTQRSHLTTSGSPGPHPRKTRPQNLVLQGLCLHLPDPLQRVLRVSPPHHLHHLPWGSPGRLPRGHGFRSGPEVATTELWGPAHLAQAGFITQASQS